MPRHHCPCQWQKHGEGKPMSQGEMGTKAKQLEGREGFSIENMQEQYWIHQESLQTLFLCALCTIDKDHHN